MKKNFYKLFAFIFSLSVIHVNAQFFNYLSSKARVEQGIYNDLGNLGTKITTNFKGQPLSNTNDNSSIQNIGFTFNLAGTNFTQFTLNTNGFIKLGNDTAAISESSDILFSTHPKSVNVLYPFNSQLSPNSNVEFRVYTSGNVGNRRCFIQFKGLTDNGCSTCQNPPNNDPTLKQYDDVEFQIILEEGSNIVNYVYGNWTPNLNTAGYIPFNAGIKSDSPANSVNATKSSQSSHFNTVFVDGAYTGNRFNNRNNLLPVGGVTLIFEPLTILNNNVQLLSSYIVGKVPKNYDHTMTVNLQNIGATTLTNFPVTVTVSGANSATYTETIASLASGAKATVTFPQFSWNNTGTNQLVISIPNDDDNSNNLDTLIENVTALTIGYCPDNVFGGRLGNTTNSIDMAVRFRNPNTQSNKVASVTAYIDTAGRSFRMYLYGQNADTPRTKLTNPSSNITSIVGANTLTYPTPINVTGDFFVVVCQTNVNTSLRLGFQREDPIREKTFYYRIPQGSTVNPTSKWEDFAPSNPFKLMVDVTMVNAFLPVKFVSFSGDRENGVNILTWQTQGEVNNLGYDIERSLDGKEFTKIGFVAGKGNEKMLATYLYKDVVSQQGSMYYRLKQMDKDGTITYSDVVEIKNDIIKKLEIVKLYPNPAKDITNVTYNASNSEKLNVHIINTQGRIVHSQMVSPTKGENNLQLNTSTLPSGTYVIRIAETNSENFVSTMFIK